MGKKSKKISNKARNKTRVPIVSILIQDSAENLS